MNQTTTLYSFKLSETDVLIDMCCLHSLPPDLIEIIDDYCAIRISICRWSAFSDLCFFNTVTNEQ